MLWVFFVKFDYLKKTKMKYQFLSVFLFISILSYAQPNTDVFLFDIEINGEEIILSNYKNISNNEGYDNQPSFINNNTILYAKTKNGQTDIAKYNIDNQINNWITSTVGSEYSPLKIPNKNAISSIRLDKNGKQLLYQYDINNGSFKVLLKDLVVGYHTWYNKKTIISSVLDGDVLSLVSSNIRTHKHDTIIKNIGRSLHKIPNSNLISYISKANDKWEIRSFNPTKRTNNLITNTLKKVEDLCWTPNGTILMGKGNNLYKFSPNIDSNWIKISSLEEYGIENITRIAISPDGNKIAIVGEEIIVDSPKKITNTLLGKLSPILKNVSWISGNWKGKAFGGDVEENWSEPSGDSMMATFKLINDNKVSFYEIEIIRQVKNTLILQLKHFNNDLKGWEAKDKTIDFPLKEITRNKVVFEGMTFEKISENEMNVYVDIHQKDGSIETVKFNYTKD